MPEKKATTSGQDGRIPVDEYLRPYDPFVRTLARAVRTVARSVAGKIQERAYRGWGMWLISDRGDVSIGASRDHVKVRVRASAAQHDRHGLLRGSGKTRYVRVRSLEDARSDGLRLLLRGALATGPKKLDLSEGEGKPILERVRRICTGLPDVSERLSHGTPTFFTRGRQFAQVWAGHHEDKGLQLWCAAASGAQDGLVKADPQRFFVPPYVGHRGWLGVRLERPDWPVIERVLDEAYSEMATGARARAR